MFSAVRMRLNFANVAMTVALVFAMSGGALAAAKHYLITSTKQINPRVLDQLKGRAGTAGAAGQPGLVGREGPVGKEGPQGAPGKEGPQGVLGKEGPEGKEGRQGPPGEEGPLPPHTLPATRTEMGSWTISAGAGNHPVAAISFSIPLAAPLDETHVHYVEEGGNGTTCPGTATQPKAEPGNLCVYQVFTENIELEGGLAKGAFISNPSEPSFSGMQGAAVGGALVHLVAEGGATSVYAYGVWAVTGIGN
jgi:hypothetical protein